MEWLNKETKKPGYLPARLLTNPDDSILQGETGRRVKRPRQGGRGSSHQGRCYGVFTICLFSPLRALCH